MELPLGDSSASFGDYADVVCNAIADFSGDDLIRRRPFFGGPDAFHSSLRRRPVRRLVYLCGVPPDSRTSLSHSRWPRNRRCSTPIPARPQCEKDSQGRRTWIDKELAQFHLFGDCDEGTASAAFARLRPQSTALYKVPCSLNSYPDVDSTFVVCEEDRMVNPQWSRGVARDWLDAELIELPGATLRFSRARKLLPSF